MFDSEYSTFGLLGEADEVLGGDMTTRDSSAPVRRARRGWVFSSRSGSDVLTGIRRSSD